MVRESPLGQDQPEGKSLSRPRHISTVFPFSSATSAHGTDGSVLWPTYLSCLARRRPSIVFVGRSETGPCGIKEEESTYRWSGTAIEAAERGWWAVTNRRLLSDLFRFSTLTERFVYMRSKPAVRRYRSTGLSGSGIVGGRVLGRFGFTPFGGWDFVLSLTTHPRAHTDG